MARDTENAFTHCSQNGGRDNPAFVLETQRVEHSRNNIPAMVHSTLHRAFKIPGRDCRPYICIFRIAFVATICMIGGFAAVFSYLEPNQLSTHTYTTSGDDINKLDSSLDNNYDTFDDLEADVSCYSSTCDLAAQEIINLLNTSVDPCNNFYQFACQGWQDRNPIPDFVDQWNVYRKLQEQVNNVVIDILNEPSQDSDIPILFTINQFFRQCQKIHTYTDTNQTEEMEFFWNKLEHYGGWPMLYKNETWNSSRFEWMKTIVGLNLEFGSVKIVDVIPFQNVEGEVSENFIILQRPSAADSNFANLPQDPLLDLTPELNAYKDFIVNMSKELSIFSGNEVVDQDYLEQKAFDILYVRKILNQLDNQMSESEVQGISEDTKYTALELQRQIAQSTNLTNIDLVELLNMFYADTGIIINSTQIVDVPNLQYLVDVFTTVQKIEKETLANYFLFGMILEMIPLANVQKFHEYYAALEVALGSTSKLPPRDQLCANVAERKFPIALGHAYVKQRYSEAYALDYLEGRGYTLKNVKPDVAKGDFAKIRKIFSNIKHQFGELVTHSTVPYINKTLLNLELLLTTICPGYPQWITNGPEVQSKYADLNMTLDHQHTYSYIEQSIIVNKWTANKKLLTLNQPREAESECKWSTFPGFVDSYHKSFSVYVPLGMLQVPYYNEDFPRSINYGRLGTIIGHEITHGLTGTGWSEYKNGTKTPLATCIANQYSSMAFNNTKNNRLMVDGMLTLEENLADNAGILAAFKAYKTISMSDGKHKMKGLEAYTNDQLFYIGFAQNWCEMESEEGQKSSLTEVHSPGPFRVLGTLRNSQDFAKVWNCPLGSNMNPHSEYESNNLEKCSMF